jgi:hypothetical protein
MTLPLRLSATSQHIIWSADFSTPQTHIPSRNMPNKKRTRRLVCRLVDGECGFLFRIQLWPACWMQKTAWSKLVDRICGSWEESNFYSPPPEKVSMLMQDQKLEAWETSPARASSTESCQAIHGMYAPSIDVGIDACTSSAWTWTAVYHRDCHVPWLDLNVE